jgi:hypothetical protein
MSSTRRTTHILGLAAICFSLALATPWTTVAQVAQNVRQQSSHLTRNDIAEQLGAKINSEQTDDLPLGSCMTGSLVEPAKLAKLGISGMHEGARVSVMRIAQDKVRVEVDELEPVAQTKKATLRIDDKGRLVTSAP